MAALLNQAITSKTSNNNPMQMITEFAKFKRSITPQGARQRIEQMLQSGEMTQEQLAQLKNQAKSLSNILK
jgi:hypothetical protein